MMSYTLTRGPHPLTQRFDLCPRAFCARIVSSNSTPSRALPNCLPEIRHSKRTLLHLFLFLGSLRSRKPVLALPTKCRKASKHSRLFSFSPRPFKKEPCSGTRRALHVIKDMPVLSCRLGTVSTGELSKRMSAHHISVFIPPRTLLMHGGKWGGGYLIIKSTLKLLLFMFCCNGKKKHKRLVNWGACQKKLGCMVRLSQITL